MRLEDALSQLGRECTQRSQGWFPEVHSTPERTLVHLAMGLAEEAGETLGVVKKWHRHGTAMVGVLNFDRLHEEMIDTLVYLAMLGTHTGIDWEQAFNAVIAKCEARWGHVELVP